MRWLSIALLPLLITGCLEGPTGPAGERGPQGERGATGLQGIAGTNGKDGKDGKPAKFEVLQGTLSTQSKVMEGQISYWKINAPTITQASAVDVFVRKDVASLWVEPTWSYFTSPTLAEDTEYWVKTGLHVYNAPASYVLIADDGVVKADWQYKVVVLNENSTQ
jgi:hypothetical protein